MRAELNWAVQEMDAHETRGRNIAAQLAGALPLHDKRAEESRRIWDCLSESWCEAAETYDDGYQIVAAVLALFAPHLTKAEIAAREEALEEARGEYWERAVAGANSAALDLRQAGRREQEVA